MSYIILLKCRNTQTNSQKKTLSLTHHLFRIFCWKLPLYYKIIYCDKYKEPVFWQNFWNCWSTAAEARRIIVEFGISKSWLNRYFDRNQLPQQHSKLLPITWPVLWAQWSPWPENLSTRFQNNLPSLQQNPTRNNQNPNQRAPKIPPWNLFILWT